MAPITRRWLVLAGSLAPASLAAAQTIVFGDVHDHMRNFQSAVLWDVNNDGKKELVIGGGNEVGHAVYDPDHISEEEIGGGLWRLSEGSADYRGGLLEFGNERTPPRPVTILGKAGEGRLETMLEQVFGRWFEDRA